MQLILLKGPICYIILIDPDLIKIKIHDTFLVFDKGEINFVVIRWRALTLNIMFSM